MLEVGGIRYTDRDGGMLHDLVDAGSVHWPGHTVLVDCAAGMFDLDSARVLVGANFLLPSAYVRLHADLSDIFLLYKTTRTRTAARVLDI